MSREIEDIKTISGTSGDKKNTMSAIINLHDKLKRRVDKTRRHSN